MYGSYVVLSVLIPKSSVCMGDVLRVLSVCSAPSVSCVWELCCFECAVLIPKCSVCIGDVLCCVIILGCC